MRPALRVESERVPAGLWDFIGQEFQGHEAMEPYILCLVNNTHPAPAQFFDDEVVRDRLIDHAVRILRRAKGQVN